MVAVFIFLLASLVFSQEAMFGLDWGMSAEQVESSGVALAKTEIDRNFSIYRTASLPKNLSDVESYTLIFDQSSLCKIVMTGRTIGNDPYGTDGKARFSVIENLLKAKYGKPESHCLAGLELYKDRDEFYECLKYRGCGLWMSSFKAENKSMLLQLKGLGRGTGFITLTIESLAFPEAVRKYQASGNKADADAL